MNNERYRARQRLRHATDPRALYPGTYLMKESEPSTVRIPNIGAIARLTDEEVDALLREEEPS